MPTYHLGTLDETAKAALNAEPEESGGSTEKRDTFLQSRVWTRAFLETKKIISWDTRVFSFRLEHSEQRLGLPVGQHLMMRLRDPVTREAIIRSYTPVSEINDKGLLHILIKIYFDNKETKGGKMTMALESLPIGHFIDFKGPIGKFEYLGKGECSINGHPRRVKNFVMICGGSGITPIFQVFRAIMQDPDDSTSCVVLDGNRLVEDILCKEELDALAKGNDHKCKILYTLSKANDDWTGLRGRIDAKLVEAHCVRDADSLVLICGPEALEKAMHKALLDQGWTDDQMVFF